MSTLCSIRVTNRTRRPIPAHPYGAMLTYAAPVYQIIARHNPLHSVGGCPRGASARDLLTLVDRVWLRIREECETKGSTS